MPAFSCISFSTAFALPAPPSTIPHPCLPPPLIPLPPAYSLTMPFIPHAPFPSPSSSLGWGGCGSGVGEADIVCVWEVEAGL